MPQDTRLPRADPVEWNLQGLIGRRCEVEGPEFYRYVNDVAGVEVGSELRIL